MDIENRGSNKIRRLITWFCRITLLAGASFMTYVVLLPQYNFSHWIPHAQLKRLGAPYSLQLWIDHNMDKLSHIVGAIIIMLLLYGAKLFFQQHFRLRLHLCTVITLCCVLGAELAQKWIGRGFSVPDIVVGIGGVLIAIALVKKTKLGNFLS